MKKKNVGLASMQHYYVILVLVASSPLKVPASKGALGYSEFGQKQQLCSCQLISYAKKADTHMQCLLWFCGLPHSNTRNCFVLHL